MCWQPKKQESAKETNDAKELSQAPQNFGKAKEEPEGRHISLISEGAFTHMTSRPLRYFECHWPPGIPLAFPATKNNVYIYIYKLACGAS